VRFPDIPGCLGVGDTPEEAVEDGQQALFACLDALKAVDRPPLSRPRRPHEFAIPEAWLLGSILGAAYEPAPGLGKIYRFVPSVAPTAQRLGRFLALVKNAA